MLKAAIEKIQAMTRPEVVGIGGCNYIIGKDGDYTQIREDLDMVEMINLNSLDAMVKFVKNEGVFQQGDSILFLTVPKHDTVKCFTSPCDCERNRRTYLYCAAATDVPGWGEEMKLDFERAQIALRTRFQPTADTEYAQKLLSDISTGCKVTYNDNGVATTVVTKTGVSLQTQTTIRPIVNLRPYRTFQEIDQPSSDFLIRLSDRYISFIEADGGMWKLAARKGIKEYLEKELQEMIENGRVVVTL